jgi:hypothetical protein
MGSDTGFHDCAHIDVRCPHWKNDTPLTLDSFHDDLFDTWDQACGIHTRFTSIVCVGTPLEDGRQVLSVQ